MPLDIGKITERTCTSARVISALCEIIDRQQPVDFTDQWPSSYQGALWEAQELGRPEPYIWDVY